MNRTDARRWWRLLAALLVPLIIAGGLIGAQWKSQARLERVTAALVNNDEMITYNGQPIPVGRLLADALINNHQANITWELANDQGGSDGLRSGKYTAVVTVPKSFSADAMSSVVDPKNARQATVDVRLSEQAQANDPNLAAVLVNSATTALNQQLAGQYLDGMFAGFSDQAEQLAQVSAAATKLAAAGTQVADGNRQLADGVGKLNGGAEQLQGGIDQFNGGLQSYVAGVQQYTGGVDQAAAGAQQYAGGVQSYTDGVNQAAAGSGQLTDGLRRYTDGVKQASGGLQQATARLPELQQGTERYVGGVNQLLDGVGGIATGANGVASGLQQYQSGLEAQMAPGSAVFSAAEQQAVRRLGQGQATSLAQLAQGICLQAAAVNPACAATVEQALRGATSVGAGTGLGAAVEGLKTPQNGQTLLGGAQQLAQGATLINQNAGQLRDGGNGLAAGMGQLGDGLGQLTGGMQQLAQNSDGLVQGQEKLNSGLQQLAQNSGQLSSGATQLSGGLQQLAANSAQLNDGGAQLAAGGRELAQQAPQLTGGIAQLADASTKLADGSRQLADGQKQFADGFSRQASIPTYTDAQRKELSTAIAAPVQLTALDTVTAPSRSLPVLIALVALWIGALATFLARRPVPRSVAWGNRAAAGNLVAALLPGLAVVALQALALWGILLATLHPSAGHGAGLLGVLLVAAVSFTFVNHALAALFGWAGRLVAVAVATLAVAAGMSAAVPALLSPLASILPVSAAARAAATVAAGGADATGNILTLIAWAVVALVASVAAVLAGQRIRPRALRVA